MTEIERAEIINLYHVARTAGLENRHSRMIWAAGRFAGGNQRWTPYRAYMQLDAALRWTD